MSLCPPRAVARQGQQGRAPPSKSAVPPLLVPPTPPPLPSSQPCTSLHFLIRKCVSTQLCKQSGQSKWQAGWSGSTRVLAGPLPSTVQEHPPRPLEHQGPMFYCNGRAQGGGGRRRALPGLGREKQLAGGISGWLVGTWTEVSWGRGTRRMLSYFFFILLFLGH